MMSKKSSLTPLVFACFMVPLLPVSPVQAASFDCAHAATKVERLICKTPYISVLDRQLAAAYKESLQDKAQAKAITKRQREWLRSRSTCTDADCLGNMYRDRLKELSPPPGQPKFITVLARNPALCDAYKAYVEDEATKPERYAENASPLCRRPFGDNYPEFTPVRWREITPDEYPEIAGQAYNYISSWPWETRRNKSMSWEAWFAEGTANMKYQHSKEWAHLYLGEADIGNTGHTENLLKVDSSRCGYLMGKPPLWEVPVMVLDGSRTKIDVVKSEWIMGTSVPPPEPGSHSKEITKEPGHHVVMLTSYDVFSWRGATYFDSVDDEGWTVNPWLKYEDIFATHSVYKIKQGRTQLVCRFKFKKPLPLSY